MLTAEYSLFLGLSQSVESGDGNVYVQKLIDAGVNRYWFSSDSLASVFETAIQMCRTGHKISLVSIFTKTDLPEHQQLMWLKKWQEAKEKDLVEVTSESLAQLRRDAATRELTEMLEEAQGYLNNNPRDILIWLPTVIQSLRSIMETGKRYDPRPSQIWQNSRLPVVVASFDKMPTFNTMLGGGLWNGALMVYGTPSAQGKSTLAYTLIAHAVASGHKTTLFSREATGAEATARIVQAYGGFTRHEVEHKQGDTPERHTDLLRTLRELDRFLSVYDQHSASLGDVGEILHWERPVLAVVDHIGLYGSDSNHKGAQVFGKRDEMGDLAEHLRDLSRSNGCTIIATSQFSSEEQRTIYSKRDMNPVVYYGSTRIYNAADFCYIAMRHWEKLGQEWLKCKKDRAEGKLEGAEFFLGYDSRTRSYFELPERV